MMNETRQVLRRNAQWRPELLATNKSLIQFIGTSMKPQKVAVLWNSLAKIMNSQPFCGSGKLVGWHRQEPDPAYNVMRDAWGLAGRVHDPSEGRLLRSIRKSFRYPL
jgi:hypothetical protein